MGAISLELPDDLAQATHECAEALHLSRAEYIRRAVERMNRDARAQLRATRLAAVSLRVRGETMRINAEFAVIEHEPDSAELAINHRSLVPARPAQLSPLRMLAVGEAVRAAAGPQTHSGDRLRLAERLPRVNGMAVLRVLERAGWERVRQRGSHVQLHHPYRPGNVTIPIHRAVIIKPSILIRILTQAGMTVEEFREHL